MSENSIFDQVSGKANDFTFICLVVDDRPIKQVSQHERGGKGLVTARSLTESISARQIN